MTSFSNKQSLTTESKSISRANTSTSIERTSVYGSDAGDIFESTGSNQNVLTFETKMRRKKFNATPGWHEVMLSFHFALSVSGDESMDENLTANPLADKRASTADVPKANHYYHLEFKLSPNDTETMKTDVVFFSNGAKIYPEGSDAKPVKIWHYENQAWVAWVQNFKVKVNNDFLLDLSSYQMNIKIWDSKDKCGSKARFDRPKVFKFPQPDIDQDPESIGGVKFAVLKLANQFKKTASGKLYLDRPLPIVKLDKYSTRPVTQSVIQSKAKSHSTAQPTPQPVELPSKNYAIYAVARPDQKSTNLPFCRLTDLAAPATPDTYEDFSSPSKSHTHEGKFPEKKPAVQEHPPLPLKDQSSYLKQPFNKSLLKINDSGSVAGSTTRKAASKRGQKKEVDPMQEYYDIHGRTSMTINLAHLFTRSTVIERLSEPLFPLEDLIISVNINEPILSDLQKVELNPLILRIKSAKSLPSTPTLDFNKLQEQCEPVYCQYKFFNTPLRKTVGKIHGSEIVWDDVQVVLTGLLNKEKLKEYLSGNMMIIEVHDRDRKPPVDNLPPALFGADLEDEKISNIGVVTGKRTQFSAFNSDQKPWDPYGLAKVDFLELLHGVKILNTSIPILPCPVPNVLGTEKDDNDKIFGVSGSVDGPKYPPMPVGDYITSGSVLNVTLEIFHSPAKVNLDQQLSFNESATSCPFRKIIFILGARNDTHLNSIRKLIKQINALAIGLKSSAEHVITNALRNYKISPQEVNSSSFNLITGFHVFDSQWHLIVLEGLKYGAIQTLWQCLGKDISRKDDVKVLFNEDYAFSKRSYSDLDIDICQIRTQEPLGEIVKQSLIYVRYIVPAPCFYCILKLSELITCSTFKLALVNELLPSSEMIQGFSKEFGVPYYMDDSSKSTAENLTNDTKSIPKFFKPNESISRWTKRIDNFNEDFCELLNARENSQLSPDFVQQNKTFIHEASACLKEYRAKSCPASKVRRIGNDENSQIFNYSTQRLNSAVKAKEDLRGELDETKRYTYCQQYLRSATITPKFSLKFQNNGLETKSPIQKEWVYPGIKSLNQCNMHPQVADLPKFLSSNEEWVENELHTAILKPTIIGRENYSVELYKKDFERYQKPSCRFGNEPETIMNSGVHKQQEELDAMNKEQREWQRGVVVRDINFHVHRILSETELQVSGQKSFNQLDRLKGLRKDPPQKYGLVNPGYQDIPALNVMKIGMPTPPEIAFTVRDNDENATGMNDLRRHFVPRKEQNRGFNGVFRSKDFISLRRITPLTVKEKKNNLFYESLAEC